MHVGQLYWLLWCAVGHVLREPHVPAAAVTCKTGRGRAAAAAGVGSGCSRTSGDGGACPSMRKAMDQDGMPSAALCGVMQWRELFRVPEDLAYSPVMVQPIPQQAQAMLILVGAGALRQAYASTVC